jgi:small-conductance mechanosensitive channel
VWALWLLGQIPGLANTLWLRAILLTVLLTALSAELLGYRNLSVWVLRAIIGTTIVFGILVLVTRLFHELFDGLQTGRHSWHRRLRQAFGLKSGDRVPGLLGIRVLTALALWAIFGLAVLRIWGLSDASMQQLYEWVFAGFTVGSLHINPARIVFALLTLAILVTASGWFRSRLERKWLPRTRMKRGSREALVTISGYSGIAIAVLVTLAISGVEFTNLAIIAGALSVGIGFGLQNIVNNFVSGLILLFERPIKTGDWVVVGATEGYVKRIRIRSTQIQTFDRADVIVPNSDLVSNQVTNWMLHEPRGRVKVPVSVAYGSDTEKVKEILLDIANNHPSVIKDSPQVPNPMVLFLAFGDSSLNFELRCYIDQIDYRLRVLSEMNFAIDKAFREHGIEIPFPQRDLHIRNWPAGEPPAPPKRQR